MLCESWNTLLYECPNFPLKSHHTDFGHKNNEEFTLILIVIDHTREFG